MSETAGPGTAPGYLCRYGRLSSDASGPACPNCGAPPTSRYSCRHRARPNMVPYIWFPYRPAYACRDGPAWSMALA